MSAPGLLGIPFTSQNAPVAARKAATGRNDSLIAAARSRSVGSRRWRTPLRLMAERRPAGDGTRGDGGESSDRLILLGMSACTASYQWPYPRKVTSWKKRLPTG